VALPDLRQRRDDEWDRAGDRHPVAVGQCPRLVDDRQPARDRRAPGDPCPGARTHPDRTLVRKKRSGLSSAASLMGLVQGLRSPARKNKPLVVAGPDALVSLLVEELTRGGVAAAVREQGPVKGAAAA